MAEWTKKEESYIKEKINEMSIFDMAQQLHRSYDSIGNKIKRMGLQVSKKSVTVDKPTNITKELFKENRDFIHELKDKLSSTKPYERKCNKKLINKKGDTLVVHFTDWHVGRIVRDELGMELYNTAIFKQRVNLLLKEILKLLDENLCKGTPIKDVVITATGDLLDGMGIFATQETQSELSPPYQVMMGVEVIQKFILSLVARGLYVTFYGVKGNHGEIRGDSGKQRDPNANWDMQLYLILDFWARTIEKNDKIKIFYSELDYFNFTIQGWKYHIRHIAPQQSETAGGKAKFLGWARKHNCDVVVYGHYHHYAITDRSGITVIRGGSLPGADEYAEQLAEESEPIQLIWGVSEHRPVTFLYAIDLGGRKKK